MPIDTSTICQMPNRPASVLSEPSSPLRQIGVTPLVRHAQAVVAAVLTDGHAAYERGRMLPRLIGQHVWKLPRQEPERTRRIVLALLHAARRERAKAGLTDYDLNRHIALNQALNAEKARLTDWHRLNM